MAILLILLDQLLFNLNLSPEYDESRKETWLSLLAIHELKDSLELILKLMPMNQTTQQLQINVFRELSNSLFD